MRSFLASSRNISSNVRKSYLRTVRKASPVSCSPSLLQYRSLRSTGKRRILESINSNSNSHNDEPEESLSPHPNAPTEKDEPWKSLLEMPARASWRVTSSVPPLPLQNALTFVLNEGGRNRKHLRRAHEAVLEQHKALAARRDRERQRLVLGTEYKPIDQQRDEGIRSVMYGPDEALSSVLFRLYPHYSVVERVLKEARSLLGNSFQPTSILDFGVGIGSSSAAAINVFSESTQWVHGVDPSQTMRDGGKAFLGELLQQIQQQSDAAASLSTSEPRFVSPRTTFSSHLSADDEAAAPGATFCLALFCYTATELPQIAATLAAAAVCWEKIRPGGLFVMIEPGTPDGFSSVRSVRNMMLDCFSVTDDATAETCHIISPCTHNGRCPLERYHNKDKPKSRMTQQSLEDLVKELSENNDNPDTDSDDDSDEEDGIRKGYCSFVQSMPGGIGSGKGEKFSYIVAQKRKGNHTSSPLPRFNGDSLPDLLEQALKATKMSVRPDPDLLDKAVDLETRFLDSDHDELGLELLCGDSNRRNFGRIIRAPKKNKGHVLIDYCIAPGKIARNKVSKSLSKRIPGIYSASRKSRWGGLWPHTLHLQDKR